jgi:nucleoside-diphosphate-sugar epimerase
VSATASIRQPVVIFGASGFVGRHVRQVLADADVTVVSREPGPVAPNERLVSIDLAKRETVAGLPAGAIVINLAYDSRGGRDANLAMGDGLAELCRTTSAVRCIHVSTAMVVGAVREFPVTEQTACAPQSSYQRVKLEVEERLHAALAGHTPLVVIRPTAVFGPGGANLVKLANDLAHRPWLENYLRSSLFGARPMNLVPVATVASAIRFATTKEIDGALTTWLVADDEAPGNNFRHVEDVMREALGLAPLRVPRLPALSLGLTAALRATGRLSFDPRTTFSSERLIEAGFKRPVTFEDALRDYAKVLAAEVRGAGRA